MANRVRMQIVGLSTVVLGQGVPFVDAGADMLRSKSLDRNSYNSGDWFNKLDFTFQINNFGVGLPPAGGNQGDWSVMKPFLADASLKPVQANIVQSTKMFDELLRIRYSSRLFRLETADDVQNRLAFYNTGPNQLPGLIVMTLSDLVEPDLDRGHEMLVVLINANDESQSFTVGNLAGKDLVLHLVQFGSVDNAVKQATFNKTTGAFTVPARTTAVFEYSPQEMMRSLIAEVKALVSGGSLNTGQGNSLITKLNTAIKSLDTNQPIIALNNLNALSNQIKDLITQGVLTSAEGQSLLDAIAAINQQITIRYAVK